jgi:4'-phosphopantetheinyl transferase
LKAGLPCGARARSALAEGDLLNSSHTIDLWLTCFDDPRLAGLRDRYRGLLAIDEQVHADGLRTEAAAWRYLVTRAALRCALSARGGTAAPADWRFEVNEHGRPRIASEQPAQAAALDFNLSHSKDAVVVAVAAQEGVGVDIESLSRRRSPVHLADRYFAPAEKAALQGLPLPDRHARFFEHWTLKEAYIKARGLGLAIPLDRFGFDLSQPAGIALDIDPGLNDDAARWAFWQWPWPDGQMLALCAPIQEQVVPSVRLWQAVPLLDSQPCGIAPSRCSHGAGPSLGTQCRP